MIALFWLLSLAGAIACGVLFLWQAQSVYERLAQETLPNGSLPIN